MIRAVLLGCLVVILLPLSAISQNQQTSLLPRETVAAFSILDGEKWEKRFAESGLSSFFSDPAVRQYMATVTGGGKNEAAWLRMILPGDDPVEVTGQFTYALICLLYTSPSPRDATLSRMPSSA